MVQLDYALGHWHASFFCSHLDTFINVDMLLLFAVFLQHTKYPVDSRHSALFSVYRVVLGVVVDTIITVHIHSVCRGSLRNWKMIIFCPLSSSPCPSQSPVYFGPKCQSTVATVRGQGQDHGHEVVEEEEEIFPMEMTEIGSVIDKETATGGATKGIKKDTEMPVGIVHIMVRTTMAGGMTTEDPTGIETQERAVVVATKIGTLVVAEITHPEMEETPAVINGATRVIGRTMIMTLTMIGEGVIQEGTKGLIMTAATITDRNEAGTTDAGMTAGMTVVTTVFTTEDTIEVMTVIERKRKEKNRTVAEAGVNRRNIIRGRKERKSPILRRGINVSVHFLLLVSASPL